MKKIIKHFCLTEQTLGAHNPFHSGAGRSPSRSFDFGEQETIPTFLTALRMNIRPMY